MKHPFDPNLGSSAETFLEYRRRKVPPILTPHALCLTVFLSERSFRPKLDPKSNRKIYHDVKIDVYFNGELSGSSLVLGRCHTDAHLFDEQIVRFSGRKISRYVEKPWVMVPSGQTPDGNLRVPKRSKGPYLGATQRWAELAQSLEAEAEKGGRNELGELSILGRYLSSLAKLAMPSEVEGMQKAGGPKFGVIDVVVTSGKGHKDNSSHTQLLHPTPMRVKSGENGVDTNSHVNTPETIANTSTEPTTNEPETPMTRAYNELMILSSQNRAIFDRTPYLRAYLSQGSPPTNEKNTNKASLSLQSFLPSSSRTGSRATARRSIPSPVGEDGDEDGCLVPTRNEGIHTFPTSPSSVWRSRRSDSILLLSTNGVHCDTRRRTRQPFSPLDLLRSPSFPSRALRTGSRTSQRPSGLPDRTQRKHTNLTQKTYKGPSPPPQPKDSRSKRRSGETREMVSEGRMTLEQQMGLIEAEAQREQLETCQQDPEDQILSHGTRGSTRRSKSRNRDMQMPASPTTTVPTVNLADTSFADAHPNKKSKIVKLKISVPPANLDAISTLDKPHSSTNSPFSSTPTTAAPNFSPTRASRSPFAPSIPSTSRPVAAHTSASMWSIPPLSQDSALTYADEGVVRPVKAERNGEFVESAGDSGFVMGVRFLVG